MALISALMSLWLFSCEANKVICDGIWPLGLSFIRNDGVATLPRQGGPIKRTGRRGGGGRESGGTRPAALRKKPGIRPFHVVTAEHIIVGIQEALEELVEDLKDKYDAGMARMIYMEVHSAVFPIPLRLGTFELHDELNVIDLLMTNLAKVLQSYADARVNESQLNFMFTILSKRHAAELRQKKQ